MGLVNLPLGASNSGTNDWADVYNNDAAIVTEVNGNLTTANISSSAAITDAQLASSNNSTYKTIFQTAGGLASDAVAGTYFLAPQANNVVSGGSIASSVPIFYFDDADYTVGSKTQKLRMRVQLCTNATQPTITFTVGLYPVTVAGGADQTVYTAGTVVTSSTVAFASPAASTVHSDVVADYTIPSDGAYSVCVVTSNTLTNNARVAITAQLQTRSV